LTSAPDDASCNDDGQDQFAKTSALLLGKQRATRQANRKGSDEPGIRPDCLSSPPMKVMRTYINGDKFSLVMPALARSIQVLL
jgi:hypothetical protein